MTRKSTLKPLDLAFAVGAGAAAAVLMGTVLAILSTPKDYAPRIAALEQTVTRGATLVRPVRDRGPFDASVLCTRAAAEQAQVLRDLVMSTTTTAGLSLESLETRLEPALDLSERVMPVRLRLVLTGPYEGAVGFLALLSREQPQLFVDSLDLTPKVSNVSLSLSGRVFCAA